MSPLVCFTLEIATENSQLLLSSMCAIGVFYNLLAVIGTTSEQTELVDSD